MDQGEVLHRFMGGAGLPVRLVATGEPFTLPDVEVSYDRGETWEKANGTLHECIWINEVLRLSEELTGIDELSRDTATEPEP